MTTQQQSIFTAFIGERLLASGLIATVALAVKAASDPHPSAPIVIFDDRTGRPIDLDLRGSAAEILARLPQPEQPDLPSGEPVPPRGRGRPRLGVVAREVTLLPRHWD